MKQIFFFFLFTALFYSCKTVYPLGFESNENKPAFNYFGNGHLTKSHYVFQIVDEPKKGRVGELVKASDGKSYAGITTSLASLIDLSQCSKISMNVLMDHKGTFSIKLEGSTTGGANTVQTVAVTKVNEWEELVFDFSESNGSGHQYHRLTLFSDLHQKATGEDVTTYFYDLKVWGKGTVSSFEIEKKEGFRLVVLGSSTAAGTGASVPDSSWVNRYSRDLAKVEDKSQLVNLALGGYTTYHLLPSDALIPEGRIQPDTLRNATAALKYKPDAVVINLPSNDTSMDYPVDEQLRNFNTLSSFFEDRQIPVWVCTTQPRNYNDIKRAVQLTMKDSLLARYGDQILDVWTPFATSESTINPSFDSGDGVHLNDAGHKVFKEIVEAEDIPRQAKHFFDKNTVLMTYNMRLDVAVDGKNAWPYRKENFVQQIKDHTPDIFGTQEGMPHQIMFIDEELDTYTFIGDGRDGGDKGEYSALFYKENRYDILDSGTFWLSKTPEQPSMGWDAACFRICTYALFRDKQNQQQFWVFNTHLDHKGKKARVKGMQLIRKRIKQLNDKDLAVILMGDFNVTPDDKIITTLSRKFDDAGKGNTIGTFNAFDRNSTASKRIDYIFISKSDFEKSNYQVPINIKNGNYPSDHFPVMIEVYFDEK